MKQRSTIPIALLVIIIAFVACYTWGVVRKGDGRADEPLTYFKDGAIGDRVYLDGRVNSVSSSYGVALRESEKRSPVGGGIFIQRRF